MMISLKRGGKFQCGSHSIAVKIASTLPRLLLFLQNRLDSMSSMRSWSLESLTAEVLLKIVDDLSPTWIINLWLTGSPQLRRSLATRGSLTSLSLRHPAGYFSTSRLPGMIASLEKLSCLSIHAPLARIAHPARMWKCLSQLSLLHTLDLNLKEVEEWMFEPDDLEVGLASFAFDEESPPTDELTFSNASSLGIAKLRPLATTYPHLEVLKLRSNNARLFSNKHLLELPPTLTSLLLLGFPHIDEKCLEYTTSLPNLASLTLHPANCLRLDGIFPSSITNFRIASDLKTVAQPLFWSQSNLVSLHMNLLVDHVAHLPPTLEKLRLQLFSPVFAFNHLPRLKTLRLTILGNAALCSGPGDGFPASLEKLSLYRSHRSSNLPTELLPRSLTALRMAYNADTDAHTIMDQVSTWPRLIVLRITCATRLDATHLARLPPLLTRLEWLQNPKTETVLIDEAVPLLPRGLESIIFNGDSATISSTSFGMLPRNLRSLNFVFNLVEEGLASHVAELPRTLTSMTMLQYVTTITLNIPIQDLKSLGMVNSHHLLKSN